MHVVLYGLIAWAALAIVTLIAGVAALATPFPARPRGHVEINFFAHTGVERIDATFRSSSKSATARWGGKRPR